MYCDLRLASDTSNNVVKFTSDLSICLRNNRSKASNWPTLKACPLVKEYKYIMISYNEYLYHYSVMAASLVSSSALEPQSRNRRMQNKPRQGSKFSTRLPLLAHFAGPRLDHPRWATVGWLVHGQRTVLQGPVGSSKYWTIKICLATKPVTGCRFCFP